ncbi:hypothetical protein SPFM20_00092 [Salmonella phage SPFM20]|nr:hypothetical protein SPFM20_00092 [Salmonella phage SPFM20]
MQIAKRALGFRILNTTFTLLHKLYDLSIVQIKLVDFTPGEIPTTIELHQKTDWRHKIEAPTINGKVHHRLLGAQLPRLVMEYAKRNNYIDARLMVTEGNIIYEYFRSILYEEKINVKTFSAIFIDKVIPDSESGKAAGLTSAQHGDKVITMHSRGNEVDLHVMRSRGLFPVGLDVSGLKFEVWYMTERILRLQENRLEVSPVTTRVTGVLLFFTLNSNLFITHFTQRASLSSKR